MARTTLLSLALLLGSFAGYSMSDPAYSVSPKAINLQEVVNTLVYPTATKNSSVEGKVIMALEIDANGNVTGKTALTYPCKQLKKEVERAVDLLKFEPAKNSDGLAVASVVRMPFDFQLTID